MKEPDCLCDCVCLVCFGILLGYLKLPCSSPSLCFAS
jgi:hypothetical protein